MTRTIPPQRQGRADFCSAVVTSRRSTLPASLSPSPPSINNRGQIVGSTIRTDPVPWYRAPRLPAREGAHRTLHPDRLPWRAEHRGGRHQRPRPDRRHLREPRCRAGWPAEPHADADDDDDDAGRVTAGEPVQKRQLRKGGASCPCQSARPSVVRYAHSSPAPPRSRWSPWTTRTSDGVSRPTTALSACKDSLDRRRGAPDREKIHPGVAGPSLASRHCGVSAALPADELVVSPVRARRLPEVTRSPRSCRSPMATLGTPRVTIVYFSAVAATSGLDHRALLPPWVP